MKGTTHFTRTIEAYLNERAASDPLFAPALLKPNKNIEECVAYIINEVKASGCNGFADEEIYSMAVHYYPHSKIYAPKLYLHNSLLYIYTQKYNTMDIVIKKQTAFRLNEELLTALRSAAKSEHRSLNNYVETLLMRAVYTEPNEETKEAIEEARLGRSAGVLNTNSFEEFMTSINDIK